MQRGIAFVFAILLALNGGRAAAEGNPTKEFLMSCTYGVLAGTLVGAASLAFTKKPGDNMNKVARGASFGLYGGILLGFYVVYIVPGMETEESDPVALAERFPLTFGPLFSQSGLDGVQAQWKVLSF